MVKPLRRTIRLIASSQPSGVERSQEMRDRLPLSSFVWQVPHLEMTSGSVTGIPSSGFSWAAAGPAPGLALRCACAGKIANDAAMAQQRPTFVITLSLAITLFYNNSHSPGNSPAELDGAGAGIFGALQAVDSTKSRSTE